MSFAGSALHRTMVFEAGEIRRTMLAAHITLSKAYRDNCFSLSIQTRNHSSQIHEISSSERRLALWRNCSKRRSAVSRNSKYIRSFSSAITYNTTLISTGFTPLLDVTYCRFTQAGSGRTRFRLKPTKHITKS